MTLIPAASAAATSPWNSFNAFALPVASGVVPGINVFEKSEFTAK